MGASTLSTELRVKAWRQKGINKLVKESNFFNLSTYTDTTTTPANPKDFKKVPTACMMTVGDSLETGKTSVTIPWFDELKSSYRGGIQKEEGSEEERSLKPFTAYYNVWRKSTPVSDESVDGDAQEYWDLAAKASDALFTYFGKYFDYAAHRALCEGANDLLTEAAYWTGPTFTSAPVSKAIHPRVLVTGNTDFVTWNNTTATYCASINTAAGALSATSGMTIAKVFEISQIASRRVRPLKWNYKGQEVNWILLVSPIQGYQIGQDSTAITGLIDRSRQADERGMDNRALTGVIGCWGGVLVVVDNYAPVYDHSLAAGSRFDYFQPDYSVNADPTRVAHGAGAATGTCEIAQLLGDKALVNAFPMLPKIVKKTSTDYDFTKDMAIMAKIGVQRPDFRASTDTTIPTNETSFLYITATPSTMYLG